MHLIDLRCMHAHSPRTFLPISVAAKKHFSLLLGGNCRSVGYRARGGATVEDSVRLVFCGQRRAVCRPFFVMAIIELNLNRFFP